LFVFSFCDHYLSFSFVICSDSSWQSTGFENKVNSISEKISRISKELIFPEEIEEQFTSFDQTVVSTQNVFNHFLTKQSTLPSSSSTTPGLSSSSSSMNNHYQDDREDVNNSPLTMLSQHLAQR
jgi:hypothetical protein